MHLQPTITTNNLLLSGGCDISIFVNKIMLEILSNGPVLGVDSIYRLSKLVRYSSYHETNVGKEITCRHLTHRRNDWTKRNTDHKEK